MPAQEWEQVLQALSPGELKINLAALAVLAPLQFLDLHPYAPPLRDVQGIAQKSAEGIAAPSAGVDSALADG